MITVSASIRARQLSDRVDRDVGDDGRCGRQNILVPDEPRVELDAVALRVLERRRDRGLLDVDAEHGVEPEQPRRDREHAGAAADVEQRSRLDGLQQVEAELRRRMRAGAERAPGVDDDDERVRRRFHPRRADPEAAGADRLVEGAPAVFPAGLDVGAVTRAEEVPEALLARRVRVGRQLDTGALLHLFEALREELDHRRASVLGAFVSHLHGDATQSAAHRNALFSFSKKLSSCR